MRSAALDDELFHDNELRMDAVRRVLPTYGACVRIHLGAAAGPLADGVRLGDAGAANRCVWAGAWPGRRSGACVSVSIKFI